MIFFFFFSCVYLLFCVYGLKNFSPKVTVQFLVSVATIV
jgi:hypothetical protein